jgi:hypothetical protein
LVASGELRKLPNGKYMATSKFVPLQEAQIDKLLDLSNAPGPEDTPENREL